MADARLQVLRVVLEWLLHMLLVIAGAQLQVLRVVLEWLLRVLLVMANARLQVLQPLLKPVFLSTLARSGTGNWIPSIHSSMSSNGGGLSPRPADMLCDAPEASSCPGCCSCCCCGPSKLQVGGGGLARGLPGALASAVGAAAGTVDAGGGGGGGGGGAGTAGGGAGTAASGGGAARQQCCCLRWSCSGHCKPRAGWGWCSPPQHTACCPGFGRQISAGVDDPWETWAAHVCAQEINGSGVAHYRARHLPTSLAELWVGVRAGSCCCLGGWAQVRSQQPPSHCQT
eukprot:25716-Pelagomonas_calceolata.AAC.4